MKGKWNMRKAANILWDVDDEGDGSREKILAKLPTEVEIPDNIDIKVYIEDARQTVQNLKDNTYDAIFLDPFSQNMAPELFSIEFFSQFSLG